MTAQWWRSPNEIEVVEPPPPFDFVDFLKLCWLHVDQLRMGAEINAAQTGTPMPTWVKTPRREWWWLSFLDPTRPLGQQRLGVSIVNMPEGSGMADVLNMAYLLGCNPGGEVRAQLFVEANNSGVRVPEDFVGRLLTREEAQHLDDWMFQRYHENAMPNPDATPRGPAS